MMSTVYQPTKLFKNSAAKLEKSVKRTSNLLTGKDASNASGLLPYNATLDNLLDQVDPFEVDDTMKEWIELATRGDPIAQVSLALKYYTAYPRRGYKFAAYWFYKAAHQFEINAMFNLACLLENGEGVDINYTDALLWFQAAANEGDADSQFEIALRFEMGKEDIINIHSASATNILAQDFQKAMFWYQKAADGGNPKAQYHLSLCFENGHCGVKKDPETSRWFKEILINNPNASSGKGKSLPPQQIGTTQFVKRKRLVSNRTLTLQAKSVDRKERDTSILVTSMPIATVVLAPSPGSPLSSQNVEELKKRLEDKDKEIELLALLLDNEREQITHLLKKVQDLKKQGTHS